MLLFGLGTLGCDATRSAGTVPSPPNSVATASSSADTEGTQGQEDPDTTGGSDEGLSEEDGGAIKLDVAPGQTDGIDPDGIRSSCGKIDFLFVIDSSGSMQDEQVNLLTSFPGFIEAIENAVEFDDFHVMVIDAGQTLGPGCEGSLGAGRVRNGFGALCNLDSAARYATASQFNLQGAFECMASRGYQGAGDERTMDSLLAALGPHLAPGGCNEGFLRDDAILVVTIITDEEDDSNDVAFSQFPDGSCAPVDNDLNSAGDPQWWFDAVAGAKAGNPDAVVPLVLIGDCDIGGKCPGMDEISYGTLAGAEPAPRIREFAQSFAYGVVGPVCAADYTPFFQDAVDVIDAACDNFVPEG